MTHGGRNTRLYRIWCAIKWRCNNSNASCYKSYGRRGIKVCEEWEHDFSAFRDWSLSNGYCDMLSIDRIDVNGNYEPKNCRWVDKIIQANNKRNNHVGNVFGECLTLSEASRKYNIPYSTIRSRVNRDHLTLQEAVEIGNSMLVRNSENGRYERKII